MFASNVGLSFSRSLGQLTVITGQAVGGLSHSLQFETATVLEALEVCWCPSFTSTVAVYTPNGTPLRSQVILWPSPRMRPAVTDHVKRSSALSGTVADATNVTWLPLGQFDDEMAVFVFGQGSVIDELDAWTETMGGRLHRNTARLLNGRLIPWIIHEKNLRTGFGGFSSLSGRHAGAAVGATVVVAAKASARDAKSAGVKHKSAQQRIIRRRERAKHLLPN